MKKFVLIAVCMFCLLPFVSLSQKQDITLEEAVNGQFRQFYPDQLNQLTWLPTSDNFVYVKDSSLYLGSPKGKEKAWITTADINKWGAEILGQKLKSFPTVHWISDQFFWFAQGTMYFEVNTKDKKILKIATLPSNQENLDYHEKSRNMAFTRKNNLFVVYEGAERQLTQNREGEVSGQSISRNEYGISKGTFWSSDGEKLAFYHKDESNVTMYPIIDYNVRPAVVNNIRYPMAGDTSEIVSVGVADLKNGTTVFLDLGPKTDQYYATNLTWSPDGRFIYLILLDRQTTEARLKEFDATTGKETKTILVETDEKWMEPMQPIKFLPGQSDLFFYYTWRDGFHNYYMYGLDGKLRGRTQALFELKEILGFNSAKTIMYVSGTGNNPTEMHAYSVDLQDLSIQRLTATNGTHDVKVSPSGAFVLDTYSSISTETKNLSHESGTRIPLKTDLSSSGGRLIRNLHTASDPLNNKNIGLTSIFSIKGVDGTELWCRLIKPSNFDSNRKYPVIVYLYNGPHAQMVTNNWLGGSALWMNYMAEKGYLVFTIDGRGSVNRGKKFEQALYRQIGVVEVEDQLTGLEWLKKQSFVDPDRIGVHGWSYGGFMTTSLMLKHPGAYKVGVAGGPVIDWTYYEVMYTERYMDTPQENPEGYAQSNLTKLLPALEGKLLMIHGADDDVVVLQHNMQFLKASVAAGKQVDFFVYPGHKHNVRGIDRVHLMEKILDYFEANL